MIKRILVPLDESTLAEQAIPVATRIIGSDPQGSIQLIRVVDIEREFSMYMNGAVVLTQDALDKDMAGASSYLAQLSRSPLLATVKTNTEVYTGSPASQIIEVARNEHTDLIVMCSHGETGIKRWMMGNVAHKVVRHSAVPVLVLHGNENNATGLFSQSTRPLRVLVTLDGSPLSENVLEPLIRIVAQLATSGECHINLLRVIDIPYQYSGRASQFSVDSKMLEEARQQVESYMQHVTERLQADLARAASSVAFTITASIKVETDVSSTIITIAEHGDVGEENLGSYDLVAMATHGRSAIARWAVGSVTERILDTTKLPLLIVRPCEVQSEVTGK